MTMSLQVCSKLLIVIAYMSPLGRNDPLVAPRVWREMDGDSSLLRSLKVSPPFFKIPTLQPTLPLREADHERSIMVVPLQ